MKSDDALVLFPGDRYIPMMGALLMGIPAIILWNIAGLVFSFILCAAGFFAFGIHTYYLKKGNEEFSTPISKAILIATLGISIGELIATIMVIIS